MTEESTNLNLRLLLETLQVNNFTAMLPEYQVQTIEEVRLLLQSRYVSMPSKRQLLTFMDALKTTSIDDEAVRKIEVAFDEWNTPPI